eukprot:COSAG01_NODE_26247_length_720_cov_0.544283_2_plen_150_part_01
MRRLAADQHGGVPAPPPQCCSAASAPELTTTKPATTMPPPPLRAMRVGGFGAAVDTGAAESACSVDFWATVSLRRTDCCSSFNIGLHTDPGLQPPAATLGCGFGWRGRRSKSSMSVRAAGPSARSFFSATHSGGRGLAAAALSTRRLLPP